MAEQVSFYDKLKSEMGEEISDAETRRKREAAVRFATDPELARDEELLESFVRDQRDKGRAAAAGHVDAFRAMGVDVPASMKVDENTADFLNMFDDIEDLLASERGQTDLAYRRNLLDQRDSLMNAARRSGQFGVDVSPFARASLGLIEDPEGSKRIDASIDPITERTYSRKLERMKSRPERFKPAPDFEKRFYEALAARDRLLQVEQMSPGPARDDAMMEARRAAKKAAKAAEESVPQSRRIQEIRALPPAGDQLGLYQRAKQAVEQSGTEAVGAAKRALRSPLLRKGAAMGAGLLASKAGMAATSGGADLVAELAVGAPKAFLEGYNRSQEPFEQVKYVAEAMGPIETLQPKSLNTLNYNDIQRLREEGHITPEAEQQYREHVKDTQGFDPKEAAEALYDSTAFGKLRRDRS